MREFTNTSCFLPFKSFIPFNVSMTDFVLFQVFRRCSIKRGWSRYAVFLGSFRWIGDDVRYVHFLFWSCNCSMGGRATWISPPHYEYDRSKELERERLTWRGENVSCYGSILCLVNYWFTYTFFLFLFERFVGFWSFWICTVGYTK